MSVGIVSRDQGIVGNDATFQARVMAPSASGTRVPFEGKAIIAADVSAITCNVYDVSSATPGTSTGAPSVSSSAFSATLVLDDQWSDSDTTLDAIGRNFKHTVAGSYFPLPSHDPPYIVHVVYALTLTDGTAIKWGHELTLTTLVEPASA